MTGQRFFLGLLTFACPCDTFSTVLVTDSLSLRFGTFSGFETQIVLSGHLKTVETPACKKTETRISKMATQSRLCNMHILLFFKQ